MRILVTGAGGFIGPHLVETLRNENHIVHGIDTNGKAMIAGAAECMSREFLDEYQCIVHAAAYPELRHNWDSAFERNRVWDSNTDDFRLLLERLDHQRVILFSSSSVYGDWRGKDWRACEGDASAETIQSPYAAAKWAAEGLLAAYAYKRGTPWHIVRPVNVVGAGMHRGCIVDFVRMACGGKISAADDGMQRKSFVHVADVADAIAALLPTADRSVPNGVYNVTSVERWSWRDTVRMMREMAPDDPFELTSADRPGGAVGDPIDLHVNGAKLAGYFTPYRSVESGVREALMGLGWGR